MKATSKTTNYLASTEKSKRRSPENVTSGSWLPLEDDYLLANEGKKL